MANPFKDWTPAMVQAHNEKLAGKWIASGRKPKQSSITEGDIEKTMASFPLSSVLAKERTPTNAPEMPLKCPTARPKHKKASRQPKTAKTAPNAYSERFLAACRVAGLPEPVPEYPFAAPERKYRADFAFVEHKVIVEVEGGVWRKGGGAHSHPLNILRDMERTNEATIRGWRLLRFVPEKLLSEETLATVKKALDTRP
jgi:Protein of unknown function (DUF559)